MEGLALRVAGAGVFARHPVLVRVMRGSVAGGLKVQGFWRHCALASRFALTALGNSLPALMPVTLTLHGDDLFIGAKLSAHMAHGLIDHAGARKEAGVPNLERQFLTGQHPAAVGAKVCQQPLWQGTPGRHWAHPSPQPDV